MSRYIDVSQLYQCETCFYHKNGKCTTYCDHSESYRPAYDKLKFVDAEPVRHGHWTETLLIVRDENGDFILTSEKAVRCSECCCTFDMKKLWARDFCPNCGANMDEGVKDDA